jgi:hypothetical protein
MFKFKRSVAGLIAAAVVAGLGAGGATTQVADAATPCTWRVPDYIGINQSNGWHVYTGYREADFKYRAYAYGAGDSDRLRGTLKLTRFDTSGTVPQVEFTITWDNGSGGVYSGTIDRYGFVSGTTVDRWHRTSRAWFSFDQTMDCA